MSPAASGERHEPTAPRRFRRIMLAFDSTSDSQMTLDSVVTLAARLEAELTGLFVEDVDLLRLAEHTEVHVVGMLPVGRRPLDSSVIERRLRRQQAISREAMRRAAERRQVASRFEVRRGRVAAEVLASAEQADLLIVDWRSGGISVGVPGRPAAPGAVARAIAEGAARSVLVLRHDRPLSGPVLAVYDGSPAAEAVLETAIDMAENDGGMLEVVLLTGRLDDVRQWQTRVGEGLAWHGLTARFHHMPAAETDQLCRAARRFGAGLMVLGADQPGLSGPQLRRLLAAADCSVLLVR